MQRKAVWESVKIFKVELSTTFHYQQLLICHCLHHHYSVTDVIFIVDVIIVHILHIVICSCCEGTHLAVTTLEWNTQNRQLFTFSWLCTPTQSSSIRSPFFVRDIPISIFLHRLIIYFLRSGIYLWDVKTMKLVESSIGKIKARVWMLTMIYPFVFVVGGADFKAWDEQRSKEWVLDSNLTHNRVH